MFFVARSALASLPLLGVPLMMGKRRNDRSPVMQGMIGAVVSGGAWMTAIMSIDLSNDALNDMVLLFGLIAGLFVTVVSGLLVTTVWWMVKRTPGFREG